MIKITAITCIHEHEFQSKFIDAWHLRYNFCAVHVFLMQSIRVTVRDADKTKWGKNYCKMHNKTLLYYGCYIYLTIVECGDMAAEKAKCIQIALF